MNSKQDCNSIDVILEEVDMLFRSKVKTGKIVSVLDH